MSKKPINTDQDDSEWSLEDLEIESDLQIDEDDFGFLIDSEGNLKTVFGTEELFENPPENVAKVLAIFGVGNASSLARAGVTIH